MKTLTPRGSDKPKTAPADAIRLPEPALALSKRDEPVSRSLSKAVFLHLEGKLRDALKELREAVDRGERQPALFSAMGHLEYELHEYEAAVKSYTRLLELEPAHRTGHFNRAVCLGKLGSWAEAEAAFQKALACDASRTEAQLGLGTCLVHLDRAEDALRVFTNYLVRFPDHEEATFGKAVALQLAGRFEEAAQIYQRILARNPRSEQCLANLVVMNLARQDYEPVRRYAEMLRALAPDSQVALEALATAAFSSGDFSAAAQYARRLTEIVPDHFENWFNLGVAYQKLGNFPHAAEAYSRAALLKPDSAQVLLDLGVVHQKLGDLAAARAAYERALQLEPNLAGAIWNLALVLEQQGERAEAEKLYARLPENNPESEEASFRLGYLRLLRGEFRGSSEAFLACLRKRADWPEAHLNAGIAFWRGGDPGAARRAFEKVLALKPGSTDALRGLAALALEQADYAQAFDLHRRLIDAGERSPELFYNIGLICQKRNQVRDAILYYQEALKEDPEFPEALLNLGHALRFIGREEEARACWRRAIVAKPELAQNYFEPSEP